MRRALSCLLASLVVVSVQAGEAGKVERDVSYSKAGGGLTRLDVYGLGAGEKGPVVVWVHGGGWERGDKGRGLGKPKAFNERGYVFVTINYRFHPAVTYKEQAGDVAQAVRWVRDHAGDYGGDPGRIFLMGHSAGAHLVALAGTDGRYLESVGLKLSDLSGVVPVDGACYDVPRQIGQAVLPAMKALYTKVFTENEATQKDASPVTHVAGGRGVPPFLILHVARRRDSKAQSEQLAAARREAQYLDLTWSEGHGCRGLPHP